MKEDFLPFQECLMTFLKLNFLFGHTTILLQKEISLELAAPGMKKNDFKVGVEDDVLTISAEREETKEENEEMYNRREFTYASFQRKFTLPETIDANKVTAKYEDGVLLLSLPKKPEAQPKPAKTIKIS